MKRPLILTMCALAAIGTVGCPSPYTLGFPGQYPTARWFARFAPDCPEITVYYPTARPRLKGLPIIIYTAGWNQPRASYEGFGKQFAQWGYVSIVRSSPSLGLLNIGDGREDEHLRELERIIDWCAAESLRPESPLFDMADANTVGVTGHSMGADVSVKAGLMDPRIRAVVSLDVTYYYNTSEDYTQERFDASTAAYMYVRMGEGGYCTKPPFATSELFDITRAPTVEVTVAGGDHMDLEDSIMGVDYFALIFCPGGSADPQLVRDITTRYMIAWYNVHLKGLKEFDSYYNGPRSQEDEAAGLVTIRRKLPPKRRTIEQMIQPGFGY